MFDLIDKDKIDMISGTSLSPSPDGLKRFYDNIDRYSKKIILRPQEVSNNGEVARRLGVIAMNTALEMDIYGHVNSTHVSGTKLMNGIGGSGDFARNGFLSCFFCHSTAKGGKLSAVVPMCSHVDHTEHDTHVFISEQGVAACPRKKEQRASSTTSLIRPSEISSWTTTKEHAQLAAKARPRISSQKHSNSMKASLKPATCTSRNNLIIQEAA